MIIATLNGPADTTRRKLVRNTATRMIGPGIPVAPPYSGPGIIPLALTPEQRRRKVEARRQGRPCMCKLKKADPAALAGLGDYSEWFDVERGQGSWLSSAFKKVTGTKLSNVTGAVAGNIPVVGGIVQGIINGSNNSGGSNTQTQLQLPAGQSSNITDIFKSVADIINGINRTVINPVPSTPTPQPKPASSIDGKTLAIAGGIGAAALVGLALVARR